MVFYLACCTVCNNLTLLSLLSVTHHLFGTVFLLLFVVFCNGHTVAHHTLLFSFFHHHSSVLPFSSLSLSLSVMAYQDGFYSAADLYVSITLFCSTASLLTYIFPLLPVGIQVWNGKDKTRREFTFEYSISLHLAISALILHHLIFLYRNKFANLYLYT